MITATFPNDTTSEVKVSDEVWQYDYGQVLRIEGIEVKGVTELDFATSTTAAYSEGLAAVQTSETSMEVTIPDEMLRNDNKKQDYYLYVWVYVTDEDSGETTHRITIPVRSRPAREEWGGEEGTTDPFADVIAQVNEAANTASSAATSAEEALKTITDSLVGITSLYVEKEGTTTTIIAIAEDGEQHTITIEDGKFCGHSYDEETKIITFKETDGTSNGGDNEPDGDTEPDGNTEPDDDGNSGEEAG